MRTIGRLAIVRLDPLAARHLAALGSLFDDPDSLRFTRLPEPPPPDFVEALLARYQLGRRNRTSEAFAIATDASEFIGLMLAPRIDRAALTAELGYMVAPEARRQGAATEALHLMSDWAFADGLQRLELFINAANEASKRVAIRCGYVFEGVLRSKYVKPGIREDTELWSRLPTDT